MLLAIKKLFSFPKAVADSQRTFPDDPNARTTKRKKNCWTDKLEKRFRSRQPAEIPVVVNRAPCPSTDSACDPADIEHRRTMSARRMGRVLTQDLLQRAIEQMDHADFEVFSDDDGCHSPTITTHANRRSFQRTERLPIVEESPQESHENSKKQPCSTARSDDVLKLSPAKKEEVEEAQRRMEKFLAAKKNLTKPATSRFKTHVITENAVSASNSTNGVITASTSPAGKPRYSDIAETTPTPVPSTPTRSTGPRSHEKIFHDPTPMPQSVNKLEHSPTQPQVGSILPSSPSVTTNSAALAPNGASCFTVSPAKKEDLERAAKRMNEYLAKKKGPTVSGSRFKASLAVEAPSAQRMLGSNGIVPTPVGSTLESLVEPAAVPIRSPTPVTEEEQDSCAGADAPKTFEPVDVFAEAAPTTPNPSNPTTKVLSPAKEDDLAAAQKRMDEFLASKNLTLPKVSRFAIGAASPDSNHHQSTPPDSKKEPTPTVPAAQSPSDDDDNPQLLCEDFAAAEVVEHTNKRSILPDDTPSASTPTPLETPTLSAAPTSSSVTLVDSVPRDRPRLVSPDPIDVEHSFFDEEKEEEESEYIEVPKQVKVAFPYTLNDLALGLSQVFAKSTPNSMNCVPTFKGTNSAAQFPLTNFQYLPPLFDEAVTHCYAIRDDKLAERLGEFAGELAEDPVEDLVEENPPDQQPCCSSSVTDSSRSLSPTNMQFYIDSSNSPKRSCVPEPDLFSNVPEYFDEATTAASSPIKEIAFDKKMRPEKPVISKEQRKSQYRRPPIQLVFPKPPKKLVKFESGLNNINEDKFEEELEDGGSGFRIISIVDKTSIKTHTEDATSDEED